MTDEDKVTIEYIKLHRTEYAELPDNEVIGAYYNQIKKEFDELVPFLPEKVNSIIDIGCGLALIDVFLMKKYPNAKLTLLDSDGKVDNVAGFHDVYEPYTSREIVNELMASHKIKFKWLDVGYKGKLKADLVISLLSAGYHYPLSTYNIESPMTICDLRTDNGTYVYGFSHKIIKEQDNFKRVIIPR